MDDSAAESSLTLLNICRDLPPEVIKIIIHYLVKESINFLEFRLVSQQFSQFIVAELQLYMSMVRGSRYHRSAMGHLVVMNNKEPFFRFNIWSDSDSKSVSLDELARSAIASQITEIHIHSLYYFGAILRCIGELLPHRQYPRYDLVLDVSNLIFEDEKKIDNYLRDPNSRNEFDVEFNKIYFAAAYGLQDLPKRLTTPETNPFDTNRETLMNTWLCKCSDRTDLKELELGQIPFLQMDSNLVNKLASSLISLAILPRSRGEFMRPTIIQTIVKIFGRAPSNLKRLQLTDSGEFNIIDLSKLSKLQNLRDLELKLEMRLRANRKNMQNPNDLSTIAKLNTVRRFTISVTYDDDLQSCWLQKHIALVFGLVPFVQKIYFKTEFFDRICSLSVAFENESFSKLNYLELSVRTIENIDVAQNILRTLFDRISLRDTDVQVELIRINVSDQYGNCDALKNFLPEILQDIPVPQVRGFYFTIDLCRYASDWKFSRDSTNDLLLKFAQCELPYLAISISCLSVTAFNKKIENFRQVLKSLATDTKFFSEKLQITGPGGTMFTISLKEQHKLGVVKNGRTLSKPYAKFVVSLKWIHPTFGEKHFLFKAVFSAVG
jgi:hypothetical protein